MNKSLEKVRIAVLTAYDEVVSFLDNDVENAMHYFDDVLHTYLKGSAYTYTFKTYTKYEDTAYLVVGNKVSFVFDRKPYYCNIVNVEKTVDYTTVTCYGLCFELLNEQVDAYKASSAMSFVQYINAYGFEKSFTIGINEVSDKRITHEWEGLETILARLYSIANVFGAELEFVTQLNDDYSLKNFVMNIYRKDDSHHGVGKDRTGTILRYPNDIYGITKTSDVTELYSGIRPTGKDGLQLRSISGRTVKDDNGNVLYQVAGNNLLAPQTRDRFPSTLLTDNNNDMYIIEIWSYDTDNVETLYGQALAELKKHTEPQVSYEVDAYVDGGIGDTFTIEDSEYTPTLYLEARIVEQEISFTDVDKCKTTFDNFEELQSQIDKSLLAEMQKLIDAKKLYDCSIVTDKGLFLKDDDSMTVLQAQVKDNGKDVTSDFTFKWYKNNQEYTENDSINVKGSEVTDYAVYRYDAIKNGVVRGTCEVTVARLLNGADGVNSFLHIAYANSGDGLLDFSLTDSERKFIGQYVDENKYDSEDPSKYRWSAIKGADGQSLVDYVEQFYYSTSKEEVIGGEWFESSPDWQEGKYLWKRYKATYKNPTETRYTAPVYDPTWNRLDEKLSQIQLGVDAANNTSKEAIEKATEASDLSSEAKDLASSASTKADDAVKKAEEANTSTANANKEIDKINTAITGVRTDIQDAVDKANTNANEINTIKETYATKVDLSDSEKTIKADVSTEITKKIGELSTNISENYAAKTDLVNLEGSLKSEIKQNADNISSAVSRVETLETDTTQAKKDVADAMQKATNAKTAADSAQADATAAKSTADKAQSAVDTANKNLATAQEKLTQAEDNLTKVTGRVDATEKEIADAKEQVADAQSKVTQAQKDVESAQKTANTAVTNASNAQKTADDAKSKAEKAQKDVDSLTSRVTSAESKITQNEKNISLAVSETTKVNQKIDDLQIGGRNLLRNSAKFPINSKTSDYSTGTWRFAVTHNMSRNHVDITDPPAGCSQINGAYQAVGKHPPSINDCECIGIDAFPYFGNCKLGDICTFSAWARVVGGGSNCYFGFSSYLMSVQNDCYNYDKILNNYALKALNADGSWTRVVISFKLTKALVENIYCGFLTGDTEVTVQACAIKLELGNKATDWTPAPEDVEEGYQNYTDDSIHASEKSTEEKYKSLINETAKSIELMVQALQTTSDSHTTSISEISNRLQITSEMAQFVKTTTEQLQSAVDGKLSASEVQEWARFDGANLELGASNQPFKCKLSTTELAFYQGENKVAWISNNELHVLRAIIAESIGCGNFKFVDEGDLGFSLI